MLLAIPSPLALQFGAVRVCKATRRIKKESSIMKALVYHGAGKKALEDKPKPTDTITDRCHCQNHSHDDLWDRPSHHEGRRTYCHRWSEPWVMKELELSKMLVRAFRISEPAIKFSSRASLPAGNAILAEKGCIPIVNMEVGFSEI